MTNPQQTRLPQKSYVYIAPVGTTAPLGPTASLAAGWVNVGFFTQDSLQFATSPSFEMARAAQSNYPIRVFQTQEDANLQVDLQQWNADNFKAVYGGGSVVELGTDPNKYYKYSPPSVGGRTEIAVIIEINDGDVHMRRIIPRAMQTEGVETQFSRTALSLLQFRVAVLGSDIGDAWYDVTDDDAFDPAA